MRFASPILLLLIPLALLPLYLSLRSGGRKRGLPYPVLKILKGAVPESRSPALIPPALRSLTLILLVFALSRPQYGKRTIESVSEGVDIMLIVDTSGSMRALDFSEEGKRMDRLDAAKGVIKNFVEARKYDRIGLVVFAEEAFTQCPLTLDHGILLKFLERVEIGMVGDRTAIGSAMGVAIKRLKDLKAKSKVAILLTDGRNNAGELSPVKGAEIAKSLGIKVYAVGVGSEGESPFLVDGLFGKRYVYQKVDLDEEGLKEIAGITGGEYFRATSREALKRIYAKIDSLEKSEVKVRESVDYDERFHLFVIPALLLFFGEIAVSGTLLRRSP